MGRGSHLRLRAVDGAEHSRLPVVLARVREAVAEQCFAADSCVLRCLLHFFRWCCLLSIQTVPLPLTQLLTRRVRCAWRSSTTVTTFVYCHAHTSFTWVRALWLVVVVLVAASATVAVPVSVVVVSVVIAAAATAVEAASFNPAPTPLLPVCSHAPSPLCSVCRSLADEEATLPQLSTRY